MGSEEPITLLACGDVGPIFEPVSKLTELVRPALAGAEIRFAQVERVYSERGALQLHGGGTHSRLKPSMASVFKDCGFNVLSVASNHAMDWGYEALSDTMELLRAQGAQVIGAGRNLEEAAQPAFIECRGVRIAVLAFCSILNEGYAAGRDTPGVAPLRAHTYYAPFDYQAGVPPQVVTIPYADDLRHMCESIRAAKSNADVVVVSQHWGVHFIPRMIADYQPVAARAAFEAGADLIVGHHAHVPKAIGVYEGKVCFFSLSNFIMSAPARSAQNAVAFERRYATRLDPEYPNLPYGEGARHSLIAKALISGGRIEKVSFLPVLIDKQLRPEILRGADPRFKESLAYMEWASQDIPHRFQVAGDEVLVGSA